MAEPSTIEAQRKGITKALDPQPNAYRMEIDEFVQNKNVLNLFLLALEALQDNSIFEKVKSQWKNTKQRDRTATEEWRKTLSGIEEYWWNYYSISSLHGSPLMEWHHNHYEYRDEKDDPPQGTFFYCKHSTVWFPTWHRPYVMMLEQALFNKMWEIANEYPVRPGDGIPSRAEYIEAAKAFRFPYWDPWMPRNFADKTPKSKAWRNWFGVPAILRAEEVFVRRPENPKELVEIENPLYRYRVPHDRDLLTDAYVGWSTFYQAAEGMEKYTIRNPSSQKTDKNNSVVLDYQIRTQALGQNSKFWQLLTNLATTESGWDVFSNNAIHKDDLGDRIIEVSLEAWHDDLHNLIGSGRNAAGNMAALPIAAFDPMFWLHHCNVDRIFALYQALHPDRYVAEKDLKEPLKPFWKGEGLQDYWTSEDAKDWSKCSYGVPGNKVPTNDKEQADLKKAVEDYLRDTYQWTSIEGSVPPDTLPFPKDMDGVEALIGLATKTEPQVIPVKAISTADGGATLVEKPLAAQEALKQTADATAIKPATTADIVAKGEYDDSGKTRIWDAHFTIQKYFFAGSFNLNFFLGHVNDKLAADFTLLKNQIGFSGIFANTAEVECPNCNALQASGTLYGDSVPLTSSLQKYLVNEKDAVVGVDPKLKTLKSLEPEHVVPFLKENLEWRITSPDGKLEAEDQVKGSGLEIKVMSRVFELPNEQNGLGRYEKPELFEEITHGKTGGFTRQG